MPVIPFPSGELIPGFVLDEDGKGVPQKITVGDFRRHLLMAFPALAAEEHDDLIQDAIDTVYAMFPGVGTLWDLQPNKVWYEKTQVCYRLLTAWFITDQYPGLSAVYTSVNGLPLRKKKVDGVDLMFDTGFLQDTNAPVQDVLGGLKSNDFGRTALLMIRASAKRVMLRNRTSI
jgi:hypothetical protein